MRSIDTLLQRSAAGISFTGKKAKECAGMMVEMEDMPAFDQVIQLLVILKRLTAINEFNPVSPTITMEENNLDLDRIRKVYSYIGIHYLKPVSPAAVAELVNMTPTSFCRYFKKITRRTLFGIICDCRIRHSCNMLLNTDHSITDIGFTCGYTIPAHFNNQFKKKWGLLRSNIESNSEIYSEIDGRFHQNSFNRLSRKGWVYFSKAKDSVRKPLDFRV